ncbi:hypothetical protein [Streptomyces sp. WAC 06725]|nr:hypothetical protein [Streptomyces sp. WAC 06725]
MKEENEACGPSVFQGRLTIHEASATGNCQIQLRLGRFLRII